jgi:hypothetical protein
MHAAASVGEIWITVLELISTNLIIRIKFISHVLIIDVFLYSR